MSDTNAPDDAYVCDVCGEHDAACLPGSCCNRTRSEQQRGQLRTFRELQAEAFDTAVDKGWWDDQIDETMEGDSRVLSFAVIPALAEKTIPEKIALIHSEVSEALEDYRVGKMVTTVRADGKPEGFPSELADVVIRLFDLAGALGIDLQDEVEKKMAYNKTRSRRHGNKRC